MIIALTTFIAQVIGPPSVKLAVKKAGEIGMRITEEDLIESYRVADMVNRTTKVFLSDTPLQLINLCYRQQGLIVAKGNPLAIKGFEDVAKNKFSFINYYFRMKFWTIWKNIISS